MEKLTKRIVAIVLVVAIGAGIGVGAWFLLITPPEEYYVTPGVSGVKSNRMIKVGLLGDLSDPTGIGNYEGAWLAAYNINVGGGIKVGNDTYYVAITKEDTEEASAILDTTKGVFAAAKIIDVKKAEYIIGGFRTESLKSYIEAVMDKEKLFLGTGASTDYFCENLEPATYNRYKYWFRVMPTNSTTLGGQMITYLAVLKSILNGTYGFKLPIKMAILREALDWTIPMVEALEHYSAAINYTIIANVDYPIDATDTDFIGYWGQIDAATVVVPIISAQGGQYMMKAYADLEPKCLIAGIDVTSQQGEYFDITGGDCAYEIHMTPLIRTNKTPLSIPFWDQYGAQWGGKQPLYTAVGAYDAVNLLVDAINSTQSFSTTDLIPWLEAINYTNPQEGKSVSVMKFAFTKYHDVWAVARPIPWPYGVTLFAQWQPDGNRTVMTTFEALYPNINDITGDSIILPDDPYGGMPRLPPWGLNP